MEQFLASITGYSNSLLFFGKSYDICSRLLGERSYQAMVMLKNMATYYANIDKCVILNM